MPLPHAVTAVVDEATGAATRPDPVLDGTGGPAGNARLTAWTGLILLALIAVELVTVLDVNGMLSWHIVVGTLLVPFALLKTASTFWRVGRYYTGHESYTKAGPPPTILRILGPLVVATTLGLLGTGLALIFEGTGTGRQPFVTVLGQGIDTLTLHQALFFAFAAATGVHILARLVPAVTLVLGRRRSGTGVDGGGRRGAVLVGVLAVAALTATLVLNASSSWQHDRGHDGPGFSQRH